jgi:hypothetical protein
MAVQQDCPVPIHNTDVHGPSVQVEATVKRGLLGVESHGVSSSSGGCLPNASIPRWDAEEGASISINALGAFPVVWGTMTGLPGEE